MDAGGLQQAAFGHVWQTSWVCGTAPAIELHAVTFARGKKIRGSYYDRYSGRGQEKGYL